MLWPQMVKFKVKVSTSFVKLEPPSPREAEGQSGGVLRRIKDGLTTRGVRHRGGSDHGEDGQIGGVDMGEGCCKISEPQASRQEDKQVSGQISTVMLSVT